MDDLYEFSGQRFRDRRKRRRRPAEGLDTTPAPPRVDRLLAMDTLPSADFVRQVLEHTNDLQFPRQAGIEGFAHVTEFIEAIEYSTEWLTRHLQLIGWKSNPTGIDPVATSRNTKDVLDATLACFHRACYQMLDIMKDQATTPEQQ